MTNEAKKNIDMCEKCGKREAEYDAPGNYCIVCWANWYFLEENENQPAETIELLKKDRIEFLREKGKFNIN